MDRLQSTALAGAGAAVCERLATLPLERLKVVAHNRHRGGHLWQTVRAQGGLASLYVTIGGSIAARCGQWSLRFAVDDLVRRELGVSNAFASGAAVACAATYSIS